MSMKKILVASLVFGASIVSMAGPVNDKPILPELCAGLTGQSFCDCFIKQDAIAGCKRISTFAPQNCTFAGKGGIYDEITNLPPFPEAGCLTGCALQAHYYNLHPDPKYRFDSTICRNDCNQDWNNFKSFQCKVVA